MPNKKTSEETIETALSAEDLFRYSKKAGGSYLSRAIAKPGLAQQIIGYRRFIATIDRDGVDPPSINTVIVDDLGIATNGVWQYYATGEYRLTMPDIGTLLPCTQMGIIRNGGWIYVVSYFDPDTLNIITHDPNGYPADLTLTNALIEIKFSL